MTDESKTTQALLRALLKEMEKSLAAKKPKELDLDNYKSRVNVKEFERGQSQSEGTWWDDGGDEEPFSRLRPLPPPKPKPRGRRRGR